VQKVVLISGQGGSGKSTCSHLLYERLESVALIEADAVIKVKPWIEYEKLRKLGMINGAGLIQNYWDAGYENIICPGMVWNQKDMDFLCSKISDLSKNIVLFWLHTEKNERHRRRIDRKRDDADKLEALEAVDKVVNGRKPDSIPSRRIYEIDTTERKPVEVVDAMFQALTDINS